MRGINAGNMDENGTVVINVPPNLPCTIVILNNLQQDASIYLVGGGVNAFYLMYSFPDFNKTFAMMESSIMSRSTAK